jgi:hypothetical protein
MELTLDAGIPLFQRLAEVSAAAEREGHRLRFVGGTAMLLWGRHLHRPRSMTRDLDCALLRKDLPDDATARSVASRFTDLLARLGFKRNEAAWQASRKDRFRYQHESDQVDFELLCGTLEVGRPSRREPAWEITKGLDGGMGFYAARVQWLDFVRVWQGVKVLCPPHAAELEIPDLAGMAVLKLRAVADKIERIDQSNDESLEHERGRLQRHGQDCSVLFDWIDERGELAALFALSREHAEIHEAARQATRWLLNNAALVAQLDLSGLDRKLERLTGR